MKYMIIVKNHPASEDAMPDASAFEDMGKYNQDLVDAGILLAAEGLAGSKDGAIVTFKKGGQFAVKDGPFTEAKELVAGFWIIQVRSRDEAIEWAKRIPGFADGESVEIRRVAEASDFEGVMSPEALSREETMRDELSKKVH
ncbi:MAG: YciI family protein [Devosia nanyangense]|uniref:YciI family protein n=1 Tax=Devosia nanyangense TaxID=1228055 RepID=A0A933NWQ7_9HYPH|nr:YciI family protein [Devosia nanyangense]